MVVGRFGSYLVLLATGLAGQGCGGHLQQAHRQGEGRDVRESIAMTDREPRMLLAGPARLLHLQVEKRKGAVTLYRVPRQQGTSADCQATAGRDELPLPLFSEAMDVAQDEVVCAQVDRKTRLSWHARARPGAGEPAQLLHHASLP